jgi:nucleoside-diphosphate-sugar epimerase
MPVLLPAAMTAHDPVILTGATGFVGHSLAVQLGRPAAALHFGAEDWREQMEGAAFSGATVFHLAARAHQRGAPSASDFRRDNLEKTAALAQAAAAGGARRLVFLSSIKVLGEATHARPYREDDPEAPQDDYGRSKAEAEHALAGIASRSRLEYSIVRSPLVYGANVKGNLRALLRLADSPLPLPFAALANRRSFVHVDDLARLLIACAFQPQAAGRVYLAAHRSAVSTARLVELMRMNLQRPRRLYAVTPRVLEAAAALAGQGERMRRLTRSLEVDPSRAEHDLGWTAQVSIETAVVDMASAYRAAQAAA